MINWNYNIFIILSLKHFLKILVKKSIIINNYKNRRNLRIIKIYYFILNFCKTIQLFMLKLILLDFSLLLASSTIIKNKNNLGSIPENETDLTLELKYIFYNIVISF